MKALVAGATGAVGKDLVRLLLDDARFDEIHIFVRRTSGFKHEKLTEHIVNFDNINEWKDKLCGDVLFSCLGTTLKDAGSKEKQWKIDYDYQYDVAAAASEIGTAKYILVSSVGASASSSVFYLRMKGQLDEAVGKLPFKYKGIIRPASLIRKNTTRTSEKITVPILKVLNSIGLFKNNMPIRTDLVAMAMINAAASGNDGYEVIEGQEVFEAAYLYQNCLMN